jgi:ATP-dependent Clp protease ATP-binding subunit ClpA
MATIRRTTLGAGAALVIAPAAVTATPTLEDQLHEWLVAQDAAISAVADAVRRWRGGLTDPQRPMASFLFLGPQGVGKTHLAKAVAALVFGARDALTRIDMRSFDDPGKLIASLRRRPQQVVLFDEVDRAGPDALGWLRQVLDGARLTGADGLAADFRGACVIVTSGETAPSFVTRVAETVQFLPLTPEQRAEVERRMERRARQTT